MGGTPSTLPHTCTRTLHTHGTMVLWSLSHLPIIVFQTWAATCPSAAQDVQGPTERAPTHPLLPSAGCCHPSPPPDKHSIILHIGKEALQKCSIGDRESRGTAGKATSRCTNLSELPKITGPEWCGRAEIDG